MKQTVVKTSVFGGLIALILAALFLPEWMAERNKEKTMAMVFTGQPVVLEFTSPGCATCAEMKPLVKKLKSDYQGKINVVVVSTESNEGRILMKDFPVEYVPSFYIMLEKGNQYDHFEGAIPEPTFRAMLDDLLKKSDKKS